MTRHRREIAIISECSNAYSILCSKLTKSQTQHAGADHIKLFVVALELKRFMIQAALSSDGLWMFTLAQI